jgi:hypothetical protein
VVHTLSPNLTGSRNLAGHMWVGPVIPPGEALPRDNFGSSLAGRAGYGSARDEGDGTAGFGCLGKAAGARPGNFIHRFGWRGRSRSGNLDGVGGATQGLLTG